MILSDKTTKNYIALEKIKIFPEFNLADVRPTSIRFHPGSDLLIPLEGQTVDLDSNEDIEFERISILTNYFTLNLVNSF